MFTPPSHPSSCPHRPAHPRRLIPFPPAAPAQIRRPRTHACLGHHPAHRPSPSTQTSNPDFFSRTRGSGAFRGLLPNFPGVGVGLRPTASACARQRVQPRTQPCASRQATAGATGHVTFSPRCSCSSAVFWSWCRLQRLWWFAGLMNFPQSPRCGTMWSTTVARVLCRGSSGGYTLAHSRHQGSRSSCAGRRRFVQIGSIYQP